ncbi:transcriptional regulator of arginine metabolism [Arcanobacterium pluranimalium]|uniref:arginine repressor n=1 Tax=Arcanobacterium pluranimalium TaxID=108028 RepID=UPI00195C60C0|nr:arginine repressor [Arcanobacterium pluranimalium]MBM7825310.1 transcriptional regulator of arginine metabolism [Arcanobacterium pluranimalium]
MVSINIPTTRAARHAKIVTLVEQHGIASQGELRDFLAKEGIRVTQATLSRDLEELHAFKEYAADGKRVYRIPDIVELAESEYGARAQLERWAREVVTSAQSVLNQVVVRTPPGAAQLLASAIDRAVFDGVLGCIAGDDTVLVVTASEDVAKRFVTEIMKLARGPRND